MVQWRFLGLVTGEILHQLFCDPTLIWPDCEANSKSETAPTGRCIAYWFANEQNQQFPTASQRMNQGLTWSTLSSSCLGGWDLLRGTWVAKNTVLKNMVRGACSLVHCLRLRIEWQNNIMQVKLYVAFVCQLRSNIQRAAGRLDGCDPSSRNTVTFQNPKWKTAVMLNSTLQVIERLMEVQSRGEQCCLIFSGTPTVRKWQINETDSSNWMHDKHEF